MSTGEEEKQLHDSFKTPYGIITPEHNNGTRSFILLVDDNGNIEVCPNTHVQKSSKGIENHKIQRESRKVSRRGKQRIRIALIEDDGSSSDEELEESDVVNQFVKIYDKKLQGKPSFLVLEDVLMRKRIAEDMQARNICHSHAEQQTSPCDIGAHTGCQTDEFLLQCALRSKMLQGQSRGCQATDFKLPESVSKKSLIESSMRHLSQMANKLSQQHKINQQRKQPAAAKVAPAATPAVADIRAPHVTINFLTPNSQPQPLLVADENNNYVNYCTNMPTASNCNHCYLQVPAARNSQYCQLGTFVQPLGPTASCCNCSGCCLARPPFACCHLPQVNQFPDYATTNCTPQGIRNCYSYPMHASNMSTYPTAHCQQCATFPTDQHQQQPLYQQQQYVCPGNGMDSTIPPANQSVGKQNQPTHLEELQSDISQATLGKKEEPTNTPKIAKKLRNKALGPLRPTTKLYRARLGRSCLILKPTSSNQN